VLRSVGADGAIRSAPSLAAASDALNGVLVGRRSFYVVCQRSRRRQTTKSDGLSHQMNSIAPRTADKSAHPDSPRRPRVSAKRSLFAGPVDRPNGGFVQLMSIAVRHPPATGAHPILSQTARTLDAGQTRLKKGSQLPILCLMRLSNPGSSARTASLRTRGSRGVFRNVAAQPRADPRTPIRRRAGCKAEPRECLDTALKITTGARRPNSPSPWRRRSTARPWPGTGPGELQGGYERRISR